MRLKAPQVGHVFRQCLVCGKSFRVFRYRLTRRNNGKFCSNVCLFAAWHLFSEALALEQLEPIFRVLAASLKEKEACQSGQVLHEADRAYAAWQRGTR